MARRVNTEKKGEFEGKDGRSLGQSKGARKDPKTRVLIDEI